MKQYDDPGLVFDRNIYTSYPLFNVHPQLVSDIKKSGFDIVSTANNHALDRGSRGVDLTINELDRAGLTYVGTKKKDSDNEDDFYRIITSKQGVTTAWVACTVLHGNADKYQQVLSCQRDREYMLKLVSYLKNKVDAVIVTPHWGDEFTSQPNDFQKRLGRELLEAGALAVLGAHPHVLQPMEKYITRDKRETFIIYSLANFVSFQETVEKKATLVLFFNIVKTNSGARLQGVTFMPAYMLNRTGNFNDVEIKPIPRDGSYGAEGLNHILTLFSEKNMVFYDEDIDFGRYCQ
jgi:poly-gamma-glutamate capsule biosynthesis protein CapA/YwtB (metallophosphatase superfamily)